MDPKKYISIILGIISLTKTSDIVIFKIDQVML